MGKAYSVPAVSKLFDIIELLASENRGFGINEIARALGISVNSVFRICREMEGRGYLQKNTSSGSYQLGTGFLTIGQTVLGRIELRPKALPVMESLCERVDETVHLCILQDAGMVLLDQVETAQPIRIHVETGSIMHPHASAFGKCMMAYKDAKYVDDMPEGRFKALTGNTITDRNKLRDELRRVKRNGYAFDIEEYMPGVHCVGAAVHGRKSEGIASIGIMAPSYRFTLEKMKQAVPAVKDAARQLSLVLGYSTAD